MRTTNEITKALANKGYNTVTKTIVKNGVEKEGICFTDVTPPPVIYPDFDDNDSLEEIVDKIIDAYNYACKNSPDIDLKNLTSLDNVKQNVFIALQRTSTDDSIIKRATEYDGIESYLRVRVDDDTSYRLTNGHITRLNVNVDSLWDIAEKNTFADVKIQTMASVLAEMTGMPESAFEGLPMWVASNSSKVNGASAILDKNALFSALNTDKVYVIPSSIHECIVIPYSENADIDMLTEMVKEVNGSQVEPEEQLSDKAYLINLR